MLRLDDLGASTKRYEWWSRHRWANVWPLHSRYLFGAWGPYRELTAAELDAICGMAAHYEAPLILAITPLWVERNNQCVPYHVKFPRQAAVVKRWVQRGTVTVAQHGVTHCYVGRHRPRWIGGNRPWHREERGANPRSLDAWLELSQRWLQRSVDTYIEPGAAPDGTAEVWHDRDFVVGNKWAEWNQACQRHSVARVVPADPMP